MSSDYKREVPDDKNALFDHELRRWDQSTDPLKQELQTGKSVKTERPSVVEEDAHSISSRASSVSSRRNSRSPSPEAGTRSTGKEKQALSELLDRSETSEEPVYKCQFRCTVCQSQLDKWLQLRKHFSSHGQGGTNSIVDFVSKAVAHPCTICSKRLLCDRHFIEKHLKDHHQLGVRQYWSKFITIPEKSGTELSDILGRAPESSKPDSKCTFQCATCKAVFRSSIRLKTHFKKSGHASPGSLKDHQKYIKDCYYYRCQFCLEKIVCDTRFLQRHFQDTHGLGMKEYRKKYCQYVTKLDLAEISSTIANDCTFTCPKCNGDFESWFRLRKHYSQKHELIYDSKELLEKSLRTCKAYICLMCHQKVHCDKTIVSSHVFCKHSMFITDYMSRYHTEATTKNILSALLKEAQVSKETISQCLFECTSCKKQYISWSYMRSHLKSTFHGPRDIERIGEYLRKTVAHVCMVCSEKLLCDNAFLQRHLYSQHNMTLPKYRELYKLNLSKLEIRMEEVLSGSKVSERTIGNLCLYQCPGCKHKIPSNNGFLEHVKKCQPDHVKEEDTGKTWGLVEAVSHRCLLCSVLLLCDTAVLRHHVERHHRMTLEEYCRKTGCSLEKNYYLEARHETFETSAVIGDHCLFACNKCSHQCESWVKHKEHMRKMHQKSFGREIVQEFLVKTVKYECSVCCAKILCDKSFLKRHLKNAHNLSLSSYCQGFKEKSGDLTSMKRQFCKDLPTHKPLKAGILAANEISDRFTTLDAGNLCEYFCYFCEKVYQTWVFYRKHVREHQETFPAFDPIYVVVARYHRCLVCSMIILCDHHFFMRHLNEKHSRMSLPNYFQLVMNKGGRVLPLTYHTSSRGPILRPCNVKIS